MDKEKVKQLADGRIYTAKQAKANGLVDGIGEYKDFKQKMIEDKGLGDKVQFLEKSYQKNTPKLRELLGIMETFKFQNTQDPLTSSLNTLKELQISEPMYLYQK